MSTKSLLASLLISLTLMSCSPSDTASSGQFEQTVLIGQSVDPQGVRYDEARQIYTLSPPTLSDSYNGEPFQFAWTQLSGDVFASSTISTKGSDQEAGLMIRGSLEADAPYAAVLLGEAGEPYLQYRDEGDRAPRMIFAPARNVDAIRLEKEGDYIFMSWAGDDGVWQTGSNLRLSFPETYYIGLAAKPGNRADEEVLFSDVSIRPLTLAPITDTGYGATVDSTLEILDLESGNRQIIHTSKDKFEAPNWSRDGSFLLYNADGKIWRIPASGGDAIEVNTGPYQRNNNDHGISPDGTQLIISDQSEPDNQSRIYILPIEGSDAPEPVVSHPDAPSYWHAWSPDGSTIAYTAQRPEVSDAYNIWAKRIEGGEEWRITDSDGLDDGADYSPDGEWIYFNSTRTGAMQIWKVRPDGTDPTQLTFDEAYRDWFPHPTPNGQTLIMVSFGLDVDLGDHPPNRDVWLRTMPADGSAPPKIIAKLFGGQGTINVPSWSPDGTKVAFVSYRLDRDDRPE